MIRKIYLVVLALLITACGGQAAPTATSLVAAPQVEVIPTATLTRQALQPASVPTLTAIATRAAVDNLPPVPSGCTVVTRQFAPEPTQQSLFPAVSDVDWTIGAKTASLTVVEYGDFQ